MWVEKEGAYGNAERRTQFWHQLVTAPGESRSDLWQLMEFSKRFKIEEVWPEELLAKKPEYRGKTLFDVLYRNGQVDKFPVSDIEAGYANDESKAFGFYVHKGLFEEYAAFGRGHGHDLAPFDTYHQVRGLRWPVVNGQETRWRFREGLDPYVKQGAGVAVLRLPRRQGAHLRAALRAAGGIARQRISVLALDRPRAGALAFRHHDAPRARTLQGVPGSRLLHASGRRGRKLKLRRGDEVKVQSRRGYIRTRRRDPRPQQAAARAGVRAVVRRSAADQQGDAGRHRSDLAADRLQEMRRAHRAGATAHDRKTLASGAAPFSPPPHRHRWSRRPSVPACAARRRSTRKGPARADDADAQHRREGGAQLSRAAAGDPAHDRRLPDRHQRQQMPVLPCPRPHRRIAGADGQRSPTSWTATASSSPRSRRAASSAPNATCRRTW